MNPVTAILAEDEPLRAEIREALATVWPELQIVAEVGDGAAALVALQRFSPSVLFLDIQMPGLTGLGSGAAGKRPRPHRVHHRLQPVRHRCFRAGST